MISKSNGYLNISTLKQTAALTHTVMLLLSIITNTLPLVVDLFFSELLTSYCWFLVNREDTACSSTVSVR